jgi:hypothetical protein
LGQWHSIRVYDREQGKKNKFEKKLEKRKHVCDGKLEKYILVFFC